MAEWSKALRSGRSPLLWAGVRISLLTNSFYFHKSRVAQWKRAGPITQRSVDRNYALLKLLTFWGCSAKCRLNLINDTTIISAMSH